VRVETVGSATLYLGDCLAVLPSVPKVDAVITDPPYDERTHTKSWVGGGNDGYGRPKEMGFDALSGGLQAALCDWAGERVRTWFVAFCSLEMLSGWQSGLQRAGLDWVRAGVWVKGNPPPQFSGDRPGTGAEGIAIAHPKGRKRWNGGGRPGCWHWNTSLHDGAWQKSHPTQKPLGLMESLISDFTDADALVLDPFMGSGTTGVACVNLGRRFIGIEQDPKHFETALERIRVAQQQQRLFA
jgi:site-specific DNA-methyltransferase (adenine-specific)